MLVPILQFVACAAVIIVAGTFLSKFADAIAELTGFGRLVVGSVLLAAATSLPELSVDISAVRLGNVDLAVGDLMGASLFNLLTLAILDLSRKSRGRMLSHAAAAHALSAAASVLLTALAATGIVLGPRLAGASIGPVGLGTIVIVISYLFCIRLIFYDQRVSAAHSSVPEQEVLVPAGSIKLWQACVGFAIAAAVIVFTGRYLAEAADELAELTGLGGTFVGTSLVAMCTTLPELATCVTALRMGAFDLAVGNLLGSNAFNMVLLFPLDIVHHAPVLASVSINHAVTALATIVVTSVAIMGQLYQVEKRIRLIEPDALAVILIVIGALAGLYYLR